MSGPASTLQVRALRTRAETSNVPPPGCSTTGLTETDTNCGLAASAAAVCSPSAASATPAVRNSLPRPCTKERSGRVDFPSRKG